MPNWPTSTAPKAICGHRLSARTPISLPVWRGWCAMPNLTKAGRAAAAAQGPAAMPGGAALAWREGGSVNRAMLYDWLKALHLISVIAWMAGMLYLPRLYVYHAAAAAGSVQSETFKVMERRLLRAIINPAMIATWIFGLSMAFAGDLWGDRKSVV